MSADDTIGVLVTAGPDGTPEYRVSGGQAMENIFAPLECGCDPLWHEGCGDCVQWTSWKYLQVSAARKEDYPRDLLNPAEVISYFGRCEVFTDRSAALKYANDLDSGDWPSEYGVCVFDYSHLPFPNIPAASSV